MRRASTSRQNGLLDRAPGPPTRSGVVDGQLAAPRKSVRPRVDRHAHRSSRATVRRTHRREVRRARFPEGRRGEGRGGRSSSLSRAPAATRRARLRGARHARRARRARRRTDARVERTGRRRGRHQRQDEHEGADSGGARSVLEVHATTGNLNNLDRRAAHAARDSRRRDVAVVEMGINQPGEVARLRGIVEPDDRGHDFGRRRASRGTWGPRRA